MIRLPVTDVRPGMTLVCPIDGTEVECPGVTVLRGYVSLGCAGHVHRYQRHQTVQVVRPSEAP